MVVEGMGGVTEVSKGEKSEEARGMVQGKDNGSWD